MDLVEAWKARRPGSGPPPDACSGASPVVAEFVFEACGRVWSAADDIAIVVEVLRAAGDAGLAFGTVSHPKLAIATALLQLAALAEVCDGRLRLTPGAALRLEISKAPERSKAC